jgi:sugar O-acyltransferase (sialic acid O-acetyltransferase NeuD family)
VNAPPRFETPGLRLRAEDEFLRSADPKNDLFVIGIGSPRVREEVARRFHPLGFESPVLVHPAASIGPRVTLAGGTILMALAALETDITVGLHGFINQHVSVAHEGQVGDYVCLGPGVHLAGNVTIGNGCDLGTGAVVRPGVTIGAGTVVGAGAALITDHSGGGTLVGVPARPK